MSGESAGGGLPPSQPDHRGGEAPEAIASLRAMGQGPMPLSINTTKHPVGLPLKEQLVIKAIVHMIEPRKPGNMVDRIVGFVYYCMYKQ